MQPACVKTFTKNFNRPGVLDQWEIAIKIKAVKCGKWCEGNRDQLREGNTNAPQRKLHWGVQSERRMNIPG